MLAASHRRTLAALLLSVALSAGAGAPAGARATRSSEVENPIVRENSRPGTDAWRLGRPGFTTVPDSGEQIKGFASETSVASGETLRLHVSTRPARSFTADVYRLGWYGGLGGRLVRSIGPVRGSPQPPCPVVDAQTGLIECAWAPSISLDISTRWTTGVYVVLLTTSTGWQNYVVFVVRGNPTADLVYQLPVTTYQAYNTYPYDGVTGKSLYEDSFGEDTVAGTPRAVEVSFDRPYAFGGGAADLFLWDVYLIRWLERSGYDVSYVTDVDTHARGNELLQHRAFVSSGHDEYWSKAMFDAVEQARDRGVDLAFFGANAVYWQIRFRPSTDGAPNRIIVCYKDASIDPVQGPTTTVRWREEPVDRPEQGLIGIQTENTPGNVDEPYVVRGAQHWVYQGTRFVNGDAVPGLVGYEYDHRVAGLPVPGGKSYTLLSSSPIGSTGDVANSSIYRAASGAWVFATGTMQWSWGLSKPGVADARIERATANVLDRFIAA